MECSGTRVQDHGQWRSGFGASWTSTGSFHPTSDAYPPYPACSTGRLAHGISTTASKWSLPLAQRKKAVLQKKTFKCHLNADIDEVWKSTSFDRMQAAMRTFAVDDTSARSLEGRNATGKNLEFQDTSQSFLKSVTVKQWSFRFSKFWSLVACFKVSGYLYHKLLGEELSFFFCFRVTGWPVDRLGWLDGQVTMWNHRRSVRELFLVGEASVERWKNWGKSLRCKCAQAFYGSKPATVEPFAGRVVLFSYVFFACHTVSAWQGFFWKTVLTRRINAVYWWGNWRAAYLVVAKAAVVTGRELHVHAMFFQSRLVNFWVPCPLGLRRSMRCAKHCRIPSASFRDLQASMWCECDVVYRINL